MISDTKKGSVLIFDSGLFIKKISKADAKPDNKTPIDIPIQILPSGSGRDR